MTSHGQQFSANNELVFTTRAVSAAAAAAANLLTYWGAGLHSLASGHCHLRIWQDLPFPFCFFPFSGSNCIFSHWCSGQESPLIDRLLLVSLRTAAKVASMCGPPTHASCLPGWARLAIPGGNPPREVGESVSFLPCNFLTRPLKGAVCFWYRTTVSFARSRDPANNDKTWQNRRTLRKSEAEPKSVRLYPGRKLF